jgi:hypothetical protein
MRMDRACMRAVYGLRCASARIATRPVSVSHLVIICTHDIPRATCAELGSTLDPDKDSRCFGDGRVHIINVVRSFGRVAFVLRRTSDPLTPLPLPVTHTKPLFFYGVRKGKAAFFLRYLLNPPAGVWAPRRFDRTSNPGRAEPVIKSRIKTKQTRLHNDYSAVPDRLYMYRIIDHYLLRQSNGKISMILTCAARATPNVFE